MTNYNVYPALTTEPSAPLDPQAYCLNMIQGRPRVAKARRKVQEEVQDILQDLRLTDMTKSWFKLLKDSLWNIKCGNM